MHIINKNMLTFIYLMYILMYERNEKMKFSEYLQTKKITQEEVAKALGVSQATVSRWIQEDFIPSKELMQKIVAFTNGDVQPNDFYGVEDVKEVQN